MNDNKCREIHKLSHVCNKCGYTINSIFDISFKVEDEERLPNFYTDKCQITLTCPKCDANNNYILMSTVNRSMVDIVKGIVKKGFAVETAGTDGFYSKFVKNIPVISASDKYKLHYYKSVEININYTNYINSINYKNAHFTDDNLAFLKERFSSFLESRKKIVDIYNNIGVELKNTNTEDYSIEKELYNYIVDFVFSHINDISFYYLFGKPNKDTFSVSCDEKNNDDDNAEVYIFIENTDDHPEDDDIWMKWIEDLPDLNDPNTYVDLVKKLDEYHKLPKEEFHKLFEKVISKKPIKPSIVELPVGYHQHQ